jgi:hypothetical protein
MFLLSLAGLREETGRHGDEQFTLCKVEGCSVAAWSHRWEPERHRPRDELGRVLN